MDVYYMQNPSLNTLTEMPRHIRSNLFASEFYNIFIEIRQAQIFVTMEELYVIAQYYQIMFVSVICC